MDPIKPRPTDTHAGTDAGAAVVPEDDLHALVDGRLTNTQRQAVEARLALDPAGAATRLAWAQQRAALKGLHAQVLGEAVPAPLAAAARQVAQSQQQLDQWWRWGGMAAAVALAFGLGWLSHGQYGPWQLARVAGTPAATASSASAREFIRQASVAHMVYAPEVRHPVEVAAAQQEHLVQWLSKRLDRPLKVPNLSAQGYELVGGRLLPGTEGARAQFMFQNAAGERVTLYLGAMKDLAAGKPTPAPTGTPDRREIAFSFSNDGPVPGFYWVDQGFGYALAGNLSREKLMLVAQAVYQQL